MFSRFRIYSLAGVGLVLIALVLASGFGDVASARELDYTSNGSSQNFDRYEESDSPGGGSTSEGDIWGGEQRPSEPTTVEVDPVTFENNAFTIDPRSWMNLWAMLLVYWSILLR